MEGRSKNFNFAHLGKLVHVMKLKHQAVSLAVFGQNLSFAYHLYEESCRQNVQRLLWETSGALILLSDKASLSSHHYCFELKCLEHLATLDISLWTATYCYCSFGSEAHHSVDPSRRRSFQ